MFTPKVFSGTESFEISYQKNFQYLCFSLSSHTNENVKEMTVFEVYALLEMLKKQERKNV